METVFYEGEQDYASADDLYAHADTSPCPIQDGLFALFISFTVPYTSNDTTLKLTPDLRVRFYDGSNNGIGCVESGDLARVAFSRSMERRGRRFFFLSVLLLCMLISFCVFGDQRRRRKEARAAVTKRASIMRRFHYIQTTQTGEVQMTTSSSLQASYSRDSGDGGSRGVRPPTIVEHPSVGNEALSSIAFFFPSGILKKGHFCQTNDKGF
jgi:hypothetical protein